VRAIQVAVITKRIIAQKTSHKTRLAEIFSGNFYKIIKISDKEIRLAHFIYGKRRFMKGDILGVQI